MTSFDPRARIRSGAGRAMSGPLAWNAGTSRGELPLHEMAGLLPTTAAVLALRRRYYERVLAACGPNLVVRGSVLLRHTRNITIGSDMFINRGAEITAWGSVEIGDDVLIGQGVVLHSGDTRCATRTGPSGCRGCAPDGSSSRTTSGSVRTPWC